MNYKLGYEYESSYQEKLYSETSEKFNMSFLCKQESTDYQADSRFRENDRQFETYFSEVSFY